MTINQFVVTPYSVPFVKPLQTAEKTYTHREGIWLQLKWEDYVGVGEAAPLEGFSRENMKEVHYALEGFHQAIDGESFDREDLLSLVNIHTEDIPSARFALETAVFDLLAKEEGKSLSLFLNPHAHTEIAVNGITGIHMPGNGFKVMKVKVGFRDMSDETKQMVMLAKSFGEETLFRLDANGSFNLTQSIRFCKEMEAFNIDYIEQPLPADNFEELTALRH
ncbi:MAG: enolase C-terminal domain-like protein, partial [SAR324 cluster bacterium]|nr:enolase C-terminal domain-like protein [SAR324 cluster bacterium]